MLDLGVKLRWYFYYSKKNVYNRGTKVAWTVLTNILKLLQILFIDV